MANLIIIRLVNNDTVTAENWSMFQRAVYLLHSWIMLFILYSLPVKQATILINRIVNEQVGQKKEKNTVKKSHGFCRL